MFYNLKNNFLKLKNKDRITLILVSFFPLSLILGNLVINTFILLITISFFINFTENRFFYKDKFFFLLITFFISLLVNIFFSLEIANSIPRVLKLIFIIFFILEIRRIFSNYDYNVNQYIFKTWFIIFLIISIDVIFELIFGKNTIGFSTTLEGRIASFFGDELVVGSYYYGFALFFLSYLVRQNCNIFVISTAILAIIIISFLIGERSSFIKLFISILLFTSLVIKIHYLKKIMILTLFISFIFIFLNFNENYKYRYIDQIKKIYSLNGISYFYNETAYGKHYSVAKKIFKDHPYFGVGIKNFRKESFNPKYSPDGTWTGGSTHPHQIHYEFLSETGVFGYIFFLIFILSSIYLSLKSYISNKNVYQLSGLLFVLTSLIPLLPSGSFFTTFFSSIFWLNYAVMVGFVKRNKI